MSCKRGQGISQPGRLHDVVLFRQDRRDKAITLEKGTRLPSCVRRVVHSSCISSLVCYWDDGPNCTDSAARFPDLCELIGAREPTKIMQ